MIGEYRDKSNLKLVCFVLIIALAVTMLPVVSLGDDYEEVNITDQVNFGKLQIYLNNTLYWENGTLQDAAGLSLQKGNNVTLKGEWSISKEVLATISPGAFFLVEIPDYFDFRSAIDGQDINVSVNGQTIKIGEFSLVKNGDNYALKVLITNLYYTHSKTGKTERINSLTDGIFTATAYAKTVTTEEPYYFTYGGIIMTGPAIGDGYDWGTNKYENGAKLEKQANFYNGKYMWNISVNMDEYVKYLNDEGYNVSIKPELLIEDNLEADDDRMVFNTDAKLNAKLPYYVLNSSGNVTNTTFEDYNITSLFTKVNVTTEPSYDDFVETVKNEGKANGAAYGFYDNKNFVMYIDSLPGDSFKTDLPYSKIEDTLDDILNNSTNSIWKHFLQTNYDKTIAAYNRFYNTTENKGNIIGFTFDLETFLTGAKRDVTNKIDMMWFGGIREIGKDTIHFQGIDVTVKATQTGEIYITKYDTDATGKTLSGVAFKLLKLVNGEFVGFDDDKPELTNSEGEVWFSSLDPGTYKIIEISTLEGYSPELSVKRYDKTLETYVDLDGEDKDEFTLLEDNEGFSFQAYNKRKTGSAKIIKLNSDDESIPIEGAKFYLVDEDNEKVTSGGSIYYAITNSSGEAIWTGLAWGKEYTVKEEGNAFGYTGAPIFKGGIDSFTISKTDTENQVVKIITATNEPLPGKLILNKADTDNTDTPISGASFQLYKLDDKNWTTYGSVEVTDEDGVISISDLPWGTYKIVEVSPATGYVSGSAVFSGGLGTHHNEFTIGPDNNNGQVIEALIDCENTPKTGSVKLIKKDAVDGSVISGATFYLKDKDGNEVTSGGSTYFATSDKDGVASWSGLKWGEYTVSEKNAANGYIESGKTLSFSINAENSGTVIILEDFLNDRDTGKVVLTKVVSGGSVDNAKDRISGASFYLTTSDGSVYVDENGVTLAATNYNGQVSFENLPWGEYTIHEASPAQGYYQGLYIPDSDKTFTIDKDTAYMTIPLIGYNIQKLGNVDIYKYDKDTGKSIRGVTFQLLLGEELYKDADGNIVEATTDENGIASFKDLPWGNYAITESAVATGYATGLDMSTNEFIIGADTVDQTLTFSALNTKIKGSVELKKTDGENETKALSGASFALQISSGGAWIDTGKTEKTNEDGIASFNGLDWGTYKLIEISPAVGYISGSAVFNGGSGADNNEFTIDANNVHEKVRLEATNDRMTGSAVLIKSDQQTGEYLEGAEFYLLDNDTEEIVEFKDLYNNTTTVSATNASGEAFFFDLEWGTYKVVELIAPTGYYLESFEPFTFEVNENNAGNKNLILLDMGKTTNSRNEGRVEITKLDSEDKNPVVGAKFGILDSSGTAIQNAGSDYIVETNASGVAVFTGLTWGDYKVFEYEPAPGYEEGTLKFTESSNTGLTDGSFKLTKENITEVIYLTAENDRLYGNVELTKIDSENGTVLEGAEFYLMKDGEVYMTTQDGIYATVPAVSDNQGIAKFENLPWGTYTVIESAAAPGYELDSFAMENGGIFTVGKDNVNTKIKLVADNKRVLGQAKIIKTDAANGSRIAGATFYLLDSNNQAVKNVDSETTMCVVSDSNGEATFENLPWGTYTVKEDSPATGYKADSIVFIDGDQFEVTSTSIDNVLEVEATNEREDGMIRITKVDSIDTGKKLEGAQFYLTTSDGGTYMRDGVQLIATTDTDGIATFGGLEWGTYQIHELTPAEGYEEGSLVINNDGIVTISALNAGTTIEYSATNDRLTGSAIIIKTDATDGRNISGASFYLIKGDEVYKTTQEGVYTTVIAISNVKGEALFTDLPWGDYEVKELAPADGYLAGTLKITSDNKGIFNLNETNVDDIVTVTATNKRENGSIEIIKSDSENGTLLENVIFYLLKDDKPYEVDGETVTAETDENGVAKFTNLHWGVYQVVELEAAKGYDLNSLKIESEGKCIINNLNANQTIKFEATNDKILGVMGVKKFDAKDGTLLKNAEFYLEKDGKVYMTTRDGIYTTATSITNTSGEAIFTDLPWGSYQLKELKAAQGYEVSTLEFKEGDGSFVINADKQQGFEIVATNDRVDGALELTKVDGISEKVLAGAEFYLEKLNEKTGKYEKLKHNGNVILGITDVNGKVKFNGLEWGTYKIVEHAAPSGYEKDSLSFESGTDVFTVNADKLEVYYVAYNDPGDVLGEEGTPDPITGGEDSDGSVLGEEAKTGDDILFNMVVLLLVLLLMTFVIMLIQMVKRRYEVY